MNHTHTPTETTDREAVTLPPMTTRQIREHRTDPRHYTIKSNPRVVDYWQNIRDDRPHAVAYVAEVLAWYMPEMVADRVAIARRILTLLEVDPTVDALTTRDVVETARDIVRVGR